MLKADARLRRQEQRIQELLAELPVAQPYLSFFVPDQGQVVYEDWTRAVELDVVR
jgi:hypothetical protein